MYCMICTINATMSLYSIIDMYICIHVDMWIIMMCMHRRYVCTHHISISCTTLESGIN